MPDETEIIERQNEPLSAGQNALVPTGSEAAVLTSVERTGFRLAHFMNEGWRKRFMTFCQRHIGSLWIQISTYNLMTVFGIENVAATDVDRPLLLVANHRSFFDMYVVSSIIFRRIQRPVTLFFPVRGRFFYSSPIGWLVNFIMGWFSMYPPFFREPRDAGKKVFDEYSLRRLIQICSVGRGHIIGFHPEGGRNLKGGTWDLLPAQPGVGKIVHAARPQVIPVFIAGLINDLPKQITGNWTGGEKVRLWFGEPVDLTAFYEKPDRLRTHKEIADHLMSKVAELAERDRAQFSPIAK